MDIKLLTSEFQSQEIAEILIEYDGPRAYTFYTPNRGYYFAFSLEEATDHSEWLYASTNQFRIYQLLAREISIRKFILNSESCYEVKVDNKHQVIEVKPGYAESRLPADAVMLQADFDYVTFALEGNEISPFSISESDFTNILSNIRSGTIKAMKTLQSFIPTKYEEPSSHIFGAPICAPGSLKMLVKVESDKSLLKDTLRIGATADTSVLAQEFGIQESNVKEVQNTFYSIAPPLRSKGTASYKTVQIQSNLLETLNGNILTLDQSHKKQALDYTKSLQSAQDVVVVQGTVMRAAKDKCSFTLQKLTSNPNGITEVECFLDPNKQSVFESLVASSDELQECESPEALVAKLLDLGCQLKVGGVLKGQKLEVSSVKIVD